MAVKVGTAYVDVDADLTKLNRSVAGASGPLKRRLSSVGKTAGLGLATGLAASAGVAAVAVKKTIDDAVDVGEQINKTKVVFRGSEKEILRWSKNTSSALGISRREALEAAGVFGNMLVPMGLARDRAGDMSQRMVRLAADMASFNNASPEETLDALRAGLSGETEPLRRFGVFLNAARIQQEAVNLGLHKGKGELTAAAKAQATYSLILKDSKDAQGDFGKTSDSLANKQRILKAQIENISAGIGRTFVPVVQDAAGELSDFLGSIERIANRKDIDLGEKVTLSRDAARRELGPLVKELRATVDRADLDEKLSSAVSAAMPKIANAAAENAPRVASAFVSGFAGASPWGRLIAGTFLLNKFGGLGAFRQIGTQGGKSVGAGVGDGVAKSGLKGRLSGLFRSWGPTLGVALAATLGPEIFKKTKESFKDPVSGQDVAAESRSWISKGPFGDDDRIKNTRMGIEEYGRQLEKLRKMGDGAGFRKLRQEIAATFQDDDLFDLSAIRKWRDGLTRVQVELDDLGEAGKRVETAIERMKDSSSTSIRGLRANVRLNTRLIKKSLGEDTEQGKDALTKNFRAAVSNIRTSMKQGTITTASGTAEIERLMVKALQTMGFSKNQALSLRKTGSGSGTLSPGPKSDGAGGLRPTQRGAYIDEGKPVGDSVPALLERGEYVLNRNAVRKLGRSVLDRINFGEAPRFQTGGIVALGRQLQKEGYHVSEHPAFGGVNFQHDPDGYHYKAMAIDVNDDDAPQGEMASLDRLHGRLKGMSGIVELLWRVADHFDHLHVAMSGGGGRLPGSRIAVPKLARLLVGGPDSMLKGVVQGALDTTRDAAQAHLKDAAESEGMQLGGLVGMQTGGGVYAPLLAQLDRTLYKTRRGKTPKIRRQALSRMLSKVRAVGLEGHVNRLERLANDSNRFGDLADRAGEMTITPPGVIDPSTGKLVASYVDPATGETIEPQPIPGVVNGKNQIAWLRDQLQKLFEWRNLLVETQELILERRKAMSELVEQARERLKGLTGAFEANARRKNELQGDLKKAREKKNKPLAKRLLAQIKGLDRQQNQVGRARDALKDAILPELTGKRDDLASTRADMLSTLEDVQGPWTGQLSKLRELPAMGVLGGQIFGVQTQLRDLTTVIPKITDKTASPEEDEAASQRADALAQLLREANLRTAVAERQFDVLKNMPPFGGSFATGGVVPGPIGAARTIVAHGGETVTPPGAGGGSAVRVVLEDHRTRVFVDDVERAVETVTRRQARHAGRGLPSRGGGAT